MCVCSCVVYVSACVYVCVYACVCAIVRDYVAAYVFVNAMWSLYRLQFLLSCYFIQSDSVQFCNKTNKPQKFR